MVGTGYYCYGCGGTQCACTSQYLTLVYYTRPYIEPKAHYDTPPLRKGVRGDRRSGCSDFPLTSLPLRWLIAEMPANDPPVAVLPRRTPRARIAARRQLRPVRSRPGSRAKRAA